MALIRCPECGMKVSSVCDSCIHCGYPLKKPSLTEKRAIAYRSSAPGWLIFFCVLDLISSFLFAGFAVLAMVYWTVLPSSFFVAVGILFFTLAFFFFLTAIRSFIRIGENSDIEEPCISYDAASDKLILAALTGKKIALSPSQYLDLSCGFFTDFFLIVFYLDGKGRKKKARLGFTSNRWEAQRALESLKE